MYLLMEMFLPGDTTTVLQSHLECKKTQKGEAIWSALSARGDEQLLTSANHS